MNFDKTTTAETPLIRIVDDEERMRESLAFMLKHEGFECCVYPTAESFLKGDTPSRPGCLLLDVQMDGMTGLELQEEMIRRGITLPIVFLSAHGDLDMAVDAMRRGACAFIQKTADRARLLQAIVDAMAKSRGAVGDSTPERWLPRGIRLLIEKRKWQSWWLKDFSTEKWGNASAALL